MNINEGIVWRDETGREWTPRDVFERVRAERDDARRERDQALNRCRQRENEMWRVGDERDRYCLALGQIAAMDFRGNEPMERRIAREALGARPDAPAP